MLKNFRSLLETGDVPAAFRRGAPLTTSNPRYRWHAERGKFFRIMETA